MSSIYYNPLDLRCKSVIGGIPTGKEVCFNLFTTDDAEFSNSAYFVLNKDGAECVSYPMQKTENGWQIRIKIHERGLYYYRFR
ncbi:MAG: hypothetical protein IJF39_00100, partial [Clostridia bacterium]|nr:hypothetical protein [Clostridia bacterium]